MSQAFIDHLEYASRVVASWPQWKQNLLGRTTMETDKTERKNLPIATGVLDYFPDALADVSRASKIGNEQHNPGKPLHWFRENSKDHADCILRHMIDRGTKDTDGVRHSAKVAWRALALLQVEIEATRLPPTTDVGVWSPVVHSAPHVTGDASVNKGWVVSPREPWRAGDEHDLPVAVVGTTSCRMQATTPNETSTGRSAYDPLTYWRHIDWKPEDPVAYIAYDGKALTYWQMNGNISSVWADPQGWFPQVIDDGFYAIYDGPLVTAYAQVVAKEFTAHCAKDSDACGCGVPNLTTSEMVAAMNGGRKGC